MRSFLATKRLIKHKEAEVLLQSKKRAYFYKDILLKMCFITYCALLIYTVFFTPNRYHSYSRQHYIQWVPLHTTLDGLKGPRGQHFWPYWIWYTCNLAGNIALFVPMGFLLRALNIKSNTRQVVLFGVLISVAIELLQLAFKIGVCDVDDVILNMLGTLCGVWLFIRLRVEI